MFHSAQSHRREAGWRTNTGLFSSHHSGDETTSDFLFFSFFLLQLAEGLLTSSTAPRSVELIQVTRSQKVPWEQLSVLTAVGEDA